MKDLFMSNPFFRFGIWIGLAIILLLSLLRPTVADPRLPSGGVSLLPADTLAAILPAGKDDNIKLVSVTGQPFTQALSIATTLLNPPAAWSVQYGLRSAAPVKKGDTLFADFWMRTTRTETGYGRADVYFQDATTYNKSIYYSASASSEWKHIQFPFGAAQDEAEGQAFLGFGVGFTAQTIEIAEVHITDYGATVKVSALPTTRVTYDGREPNAPWRKAAAARIERIRKGNLKIIVTDGAGRPVPEATVTVAMTRHAFGFATAVSNGVFLPNPGHALRTGLSPPGLQSLQQSHRQRRQMAGVGKHGRGLQRRDRNLVPVPSGGHHCLCPHSARSRHDPARPKSPLAVVGLSAQ